MTLAMKQAPLKSHLTQIERIDKHVDHANRNSAPSFLTNELF